MKNIASYMILACWLCTVTSWALGQETTAAKPNIIFILADDLGWTDTGAYGSTYYETPNIDRLTADGLKFTAYHNCQNCQPTRAALMSGQYAPRTGIYTVGGIERFARGISRYDEDVSHRRHFALSRRDLRMAKSVRPT